MFHLRSALLTVGALLLVGLCAVLAQPQNPPAAPAPGNGAPGQGASPGGGRNWRMDFRQRMNERIKEVLGATDDEWMVLQPRLEKVQALQMQVRGAGMAVLFRGRRGFDRRGGMGPMAAASPNEVQKAAEALQTLLDDKGAGNDAIKTRLEALRIAQQKAREELVKAQKDLRELLTIRQEAALTLMGLLD